MKNLTVEIDGVFCCRDGSQIGETIEEAIALAKKEARVVKFRFCEVIVSVTPDSDPALVFESFLAAMDAWAETPEGQQRTEEAGAQVLEAYKYRDLLIPELLALVPGNVEQHFSWLNTFIDHNRATRDCLWLMCWPEVQLVFAEHGFLPEKCDGPVTRNSMVSKALLPISPSEREQEWMSDLHNLNQ